MDRKKFLTVAAAIALVTGCCLVMLFYPLLKGEDIFHPDPTAEDVADAFFEALQQDDYAAAFVYCDPNLQEDLVDPENLRHEIEWYEIQPASWEISSQTLSANQVEIAGSMVFRFHPNGVFRLTLRRGETGWKISEFFLDHF